ncbi:hypothetical protein B0H13DRAFT_1884426 [Mycena leptocephala]|nr:hypothetical protein B0H13DRAFT_1884426 [Mycena leptocephala]
MTVDRHSRAFSVLTIVPSAFSLFSDQLPTPMAQTGVPAEKPINPFEGRESVEKPSSDIAATTPLDGVEESSDASRLKMHFGRFTIRHAPDCESPDRRGELSCGADTTGYSGYSATEELAGHGRAETVGR